MDLIESPNATVDIEYHNLLLTDMKNKIDIISLSYEKIMPFLPFGEDVLWRDIMIIYRNTDATLAHFDRLQKFKPAYGDTSLHGKNLLYRAEIAAPLLQGKLSILVESIRTFMIASKKINIANNFYQNIKLNYISVYSLYSAVNKYIWFILSSESVAKLRFDIFNTIDTIGQTMPTEALHISYLIDKLYQQNII